MEASFQALEIIAEVALGIVGFSAILIGLSRTSDGFSSPDNFRIQLLTYSAFSAMFCALLPFAIYIEINPDFSWLILSWILCLISSAGLLVFPSRMLSLRQQGYENIFPIKVFMFQTAILSTIVLISGLMILGYIKSKENFYIACLMLFLVQSSFAFIRTMFIRIK
jgi:hypothetical protein